VTPLTLSAGMSRVLLSRRRAIFCLFLILATVAVYFPAFHNGFTNYDDPRYLTDNHHIDSGLTWKTLRWAATAYYESNWHPLTWISHAADISLFHLNPAGHHAITILLHAVNALLLFGILQSATRREWPSFFAAALFALHPVNVESVAWAAERKNVLSMFFLLLALYAYGKYARRPSISRYLTVAILYALGLAAKPQIITLPFLLLLWDFWPLERWTTSDAIGDGQELGGVRATLPQLLVEKLPLLLLSIASAVITLQAQVRGGAVQVANAAGRTVAAFSFHTRLENALVAYARYITILFWPVRLAPMYPHPGNEIRAAAVALSALLLIAITAMVLAAWRHRYLPVGWCWFLGSLVPMIGIIQVGAQAMADRYAYLPFIGLSCMVVWGISDLVGRNPAFQKIATVAAMLILVVLGGVANRQVGFWRNSESLWNHTLQVTERNFVAHDSLAEYLMKQGRFAEACSHFQSAVDIFPQDMPAQEGLAVCAQARGHSREAVERYENVIRLAADPTVRSTAFANLGSIYRGLGDYRLARENYEAALKLNPDLPIALVGIGLLAQKGWDYSRAAELFAHAMNAEPTSVGYLLLANALERSGRVTEARQASEKARRLSDNLPNDQRIADALIAE
jgi:tetratricopeptide (TPR) repeat protein